MGNKTTSSKKSSENTVPPTKTTSTKTEDKKPERKEEKPTTSTTSTKTHDEAHSPKKTDEKVSEKPKAKPQPTKDESNKKLEKFFEAYKDPESEEGDERINTDGIVRLFEDLNVDPEDPTVLVLAYHMQAKEAATFTKGEFETGCKKLGVDSLESLKAKWSSFKTTLSTPATFKEVFKFTFNYMKEEPGHKTVNLEISKAYLALLLSDRPHIKSFLEFLDQQSEYRGMNMDQWMTLLDFISTVKEDLSNYDENSAWPVILDSYVEWKRKKLSATAE